MGILAQCLQHLDTYQAARVDAQEALALAQTVSFRRGVGVSRGVLGALALAEEACDEARTQCAASLAVSQKSAGHPSEFEGELACLAPAAWGLGDRDEGWAHLRAQLAWAQESQMLVPALFSLVAAARMLAEVGEIERAVDLYALAAQNPFVANSRWFEDVAGHQIAAVAATLPPEVATAARQRGQARDLPSAVGELLAERP